MRHNRRIELVGALFLTGMGLILLLANLGLVPNLVPLLWWSLLLAGGLLFLSAFLADRAQWWPLIPASALLGVGAAGLLSAVFHLPGGLAGAAFFASLAAGFAAVHLARPHDNRWALMPAGVLVILAVVALLSAAVGGELAGAGFFAGLGLAFVALYFAEIDGQRYNWWTLIPAGALLTLAAVVILSVHGSGALAGAALFLGLGLTFGMLYLLRGPGRPLEWAWIPALALVAFGLFILVVAGDFPYARLLWPLALVVAGVLLLIWNWRRLWRQPEQPGEGTERSPGGPGVSIDRSEDDPYRGTDPLV